MIFQALMESNRRGELLLVQNGMCRFHIRKDGQLTIHEIIVNHERCGTGRKLLEMLKLYQGVVCIVAKCPALLDSNGWYKHMGFKPVAQEKTRAGNWLNVWRLDLS
jgi:hypothetical protein